MLASPRGFSQLATSFFAYLRQGIHTHALSSLTIKLTPKPQSLVLFVHVFASAPLLFHRLQACATADSNLLLCTAPLRSFPEGNALSSLYSARQIFNCQRSMKFSVFSCQFSVNELLETDNCKLTTSFLVGLGRLELPTSPLSGVRSNHLSYRPKLIQNWWSWSGSNRRPPECKSGALPAELQPPLNFSRRLTRDEHR